MWIQKWTHCWSEKWKALQEQHSKVTGEQMKVTASELLKLQEGAVPSNLCFGSERNKPSIISKHF
jgi:hypothetical protein